MRLNTERGVASSRRGWIKGLGLGGALGALLLSRGALGQAVSPAPPSGEPTPGGGPTWLAVSGAVNPAVAGYGYVVDTTGGAVTVTLPAAPAVGDWVGFVDGASSFDMNNLTVARNALLIMGLAENMTVSTENATFGLVYESALLGWRVVTA